MRDFFGCYLLHSKHPATKDRTYIGFTVNPRRRIKQHNGIISAGAWKTCKHRPWEMQLVVYGFATQTQALQFEWAWQHPDKSKAARPVAKQLGKSKMAGVKGKISLMLGMLAVSPWCYYPLTIQYLSTVSYQIAARLGPPPPTIRVVVAPLEDLPASVSDDEDEDARQAGGARSRKGSKATNKHAAKEELGAAPKATCSGGAGIAAASQALKSADEEDEEEDGGSELGSGSDGEGPSQMAGSDCEEELSCAEEEVNVLPPDGKSWKCDLCESVIDRFVMRCTSAGGGCGRAFHLSCIAADWAMQVAEDPHAAPSLSGIRAGSQGGAGASRPRAVPERGLCPACQHQHSWLELLGSMLPYGYAVKQRKRKFKNRRRVLADPSLKPASSRGTKGTAAGAAGAQGDDTGTSQPAPKKPRAGAKKAAGATGAAAGAGSEVAASAAVTDVVPTNSQVAAPAGTKPKRPPRPKNAKPDASHAPQADGIALQGKPPPQHACEGAVSEAAGHSQGPTQGTVISGQGSPEVLSLAQRLQRRMQQGPAPAAAPAASAVAASQLQGAVTASHGGVTSATSQGRRVMMPADEQKERQSSQLNGVGGEADDDDDVSSPLGYLRQLQRTRKPVAGPALAIQDQQAGQGLTPASSKHKSPTLHPIHSHSQGHQMLQRGVSHASPPAHTAAAVTAAARPVPEIDLTCSPSPVPLARRLAGRHAGPADQHETALPAASQARSALASGQAGGCSVRGAAGGGEDERSLSCSGLSDVPQQEEDEEQDQLQHPTPKSTMRHARMPVVCISDSEEEGEPDGDGQRVQVGTVQVGMVQMAAVQVGAVQERAVQEPVGSSQLLQSQYGHVALACGKQGSGTQAGAVAVENCSAQQPHVKPLAGAAPSGCHDAAKENREVIEILD